MKVVLLVGLLSLSACAALVTLRLRNLNRKTCSFPTALRKYIALSRKQSSPEVPEPIRRLVRYYLRSCWLNKKYILQAKQARRYDYLYPSQGLLTVNDS